MDSLEAEYALTVELLARITGRPLLTNPDDKTLGRSIALKTPYLDPLNFIQCQLLADYRKLPASAGEELRQQYERAITSSIEGIAIGLGTVG